MIPTNRFRVAAIATAIIILIYANAAIVSGTLSSTRPNFPTDPSHINAPPISAADDFSAAISPFWGGIGATHAMILALQALHSGNERPAIENKAINERAQSAIKSSLSLIPGDAQNWVLLALLLARYDQRAPGIREALKMSYFTAPNDAALIPVRLDAVTVFDAVSDVDLAELAKADVRLILTRRPDLRTAISSAYQRGSAPGRAFLDEAVGSIDPSFVATLRGVKPPG